MSRRPRETFVCPVCDAEVAKGSLACPECGSDDQTGWSKDTIYDDLDLPDPGYGKEEPSLKTQARSWRMVALGLIALLGLLLLLRLW